MSARKFTITIFNKKIDEVKFDKSKVKYCILGTEICPKTKKLHLQGYVETWKKIRPTGLKKIYNDNTMHIEFAQASKEDNINYCKKDGNFIIFNDVKNIMEQLEELIMNDIDDYKLMKCYPELYKDHYELYKRMKDTIINKQNEIKFNEYWKDFKLNIVQQSIYNTVMEIKKNKDMIRKVIWIYDKKGNCGKSTLCNYINANHKDSIILNNAKSSDLAYIYNGENIVMFDIPRTLEGKVNYNIMENLKNCRLLSTKYKTTNKKFICPTIIVFANFEPELDKLSMDRWHIITVNNNVLITKKF